MENILVRSFADPISSKFESIFNEHMARNTIYHNYNPMESYDIAMFLLALLTSVKESGAFGQEKVSDIFYGSRSDETLKCVILTENIETGEHTALIRNFFFQSNLQEVKDRGFSDKEKSLLEGKINKKFNVSLTEFLIYDQNNPTRKNCSKDPDIIVQPFMERVDEKDANPMTNQVEGMEEFRQLAAFEMKITFDNVSRSMLESILETTRQVVRSFPRSTEYLEMGFFHGILFTHATSSSFNVRLYCTRPNRNDELSVSVTIESRVSLGDFPAAPVVVHFDLIPHRRRVERDADVIEKLIHILENKISNTVEKSVSYLKEQIITAVEFDFESKRRPDLEAYILGLLMSYDALNAENASVYRLSKGDSSQIMLISSKIILFRFDAIEHGSESDVFNGLDVSLTTTQLTCEPKHGKHFYEKFEARLGVAKRDEVIKLPENNILWKLIEFHVTENEDLLESIFHEYTNMILEVKKFDLSAFLAGLLRNTLQYVKRRYTYHDEFEIKTYKIEAGILCLRISTDTINIMQINFATFEWVKLFESQTNNEHRFLNFFHNSDNATGATSVRMTYKSRIIPQKNYAACYNAENEMSPCGALDQDSGHYLPNANRLYLQSQEILVKSSQKSDDKLSRKKRSLIPAELLDTDGDNRYLRKKRSVARALNQPLPESARLLFLYEQFPETIYDGHISDDGDLHIEQLRSRIEEDLGKASYFKNHLSKVFDLLTKNSGSQGNTKDQSLLDDSLWNRETTYNALDFMEQYTDVQAVVSSTSCFQSGLYGPCRYINANFMKELSVNRQYISMKNPEVNDKNYKMLCHAIHETDERVVKSLDAHNYKHNKIFGSKTIACVNAFAVGKSNRTGNITVYKLKGGNITVRADTKMSALFIIDGTERVIVRGGEKKNFLKLISVPREMEVDLRHGSMNTVDFSSLVSLRHFNLEIKETNAQIIAKHPYTLLNWFLWDVNEYIVGGRNVAEEIYLHLYSKLRAIEIKSGPDCDQMHNLTISDTIKVKNLQSMTDYNLTIHFSGCTMVINRIDSYTFTYNIIGLNKDIYIELITNAAIKHVIDATSIDIMDFDTIELITHSENEHFVIFEHSNATLFLKIRDKPRTQNTSKALEIHFQNGVTLNYLAGSLEHTVRSLKSKGCIFLQFIALLQLYGPNVQLNAYSERDDDHFSLGYDEIRISGQHYPLTVSTSDETDEFQCQAGYNIFVVTIGQGHKQYTKNLQKGFDTLLIRGAADMHMLELDLTPISEYINKIDKTNYVQIDPSIHGDVLNLSIAVEGHFTKIPKYKLGNIIIQDFQSSIWHRRITVKRRLDYALSIGKGGKVGLQYLKPSSAPNSQIIVIDDRVYMIN